MDKPKWTKTPPTEPGWYWYREWMQRPNRNGKGGVCAEMPMWWNSPMIPNPDLFDFEWYPVPIEVPE